MRQDILKFFPQGRKVQKEKVSHRGNHIYFTLEKDWLLEIPISSLTERERIMLSLFDREQEVESYHPWKSYLFEEGIYPLSEKIPLQFLYVHLFHIEAIEEWLIVMRDLLPHQIAVFSKTERDYVFILNQAMKIDTKELLQATLSTMEFDFGMPMIAFVGQIWPEEYRELFPRLFQAESLLFREFYMNHPKTRVLSFSQVFLWGKSQGLSEGTYLASILSQLIHHQEGLASAILALWQEGAILTKAAQTLYLHRNTLQYRIDKWEDLTGLQLKNLTDLTACYLSIIEETY